MRFKGKSAIVTGASTGIGRAIAQRFGAEGAHVAVNYRDDERLAADVVRLIEEQGGEGFVVKADVSESSAVRGMFAATLERWGRLDIVVNNAAMSITKPIAEVTEDDFDGIFATNVKGTFVACQEAAKYLADGGRLINISSATTRLTLPGYGVYDATKGAIEQLARFLAHELGGRGITVNTISPGATETGQFRRGKSEETIARLAGMAALGRLGRPDDIADVVAFIASDDARWITGQNIRVDGGTV